MELPSLGFNLGIFLASAVAATVAWVQAAQVSRSKSEAEQAESSARRAKMEAVAAQQAAASSLREANKIATEAKALIQANVDLEAHRDDRLREYRDVHWRIEWRLDIAETVPAMLMVTNGGSRAACGVTLVLDMPLAISQQRQLFELGDVLPCEPIRVEIRYSDLTGPLASEAMASLDVPFKLHWSSPNGHPSELPGTISAE